MGTGAGAAVGAGVVATTGTVTVTEAGAGVGAAIFGLGAIHISHLKPVVLSNVHTAHLHTRDKDINIKQAKQTTNVK